MAKKKASDILTADDARALLWERGELSWLMHKGQQELYDIYNKAEPHSILSWLLSRQTGKCLPSGTLILTTKGAVAIENLKPNDYVIGYNKDGTCSPARVKYVFDQGIQSVTPFTNRGKLLAASTENHVWLTNKVYDLQLTERPLSELTHNHDKIIRKEYRVDFGHENVPHAYALGSLLGDGCRTTNGSNALWVSSENEIIPKKVAEVLNFQYRKNTGKNYSWLIFEKKENSNLNKRYLDKYYLLWIKDRLAHEKTLDIEMLKNWNRQSLLSLLAGIIDTDGSIFITGRKKNELKFALSMQARGVIDAVKWLFLSLWSIDLCYHLDDRDKYKNGPCHTIYTNNNHNVKLFLKELSPFLQLERKRYKPEYDAFSEYNYKGDRVGLRKGQSYLTQTWDIEVENDTHMYLLANGLVTHNSRNIAYIAISEAIKYPNSVIVLMTDTKTHMKKLVSTTFREALETCPEHLKPIYNTSDYCFNFPNGSQIELAGTDGGHAEKVRGRKARAIFIDEAGFCNDLKYIIQSILIPTTAHTGGKIVLSTTPPPELDHEFYEFMERAELDGYLTKKTVYDNPLLTKEQIAIIARQIGGINSVQFRREFLCEIIKSEESSLFPECDDTLLNEITLKWDEPPFYYPYVSMDLGYKDLTVVLFGYHDFRNDKVIIKRELVYTGKEFSISKCTQDIMQVEHDLWYDEIIQEKRKPMRVSDINYIVTQEIYRASNKEIYFDIPKKDDLLAAVNNLRTLLANHKVIIDPSCTTLLRHIKNVKWSKREAKNEFARSVEGGHYDAVAALIYLVRSINFQRNPYPPSYNLNLGDQGAIFTRNEGIYKPQGNVSSREAMERIFGKKIKPRKL